LIFIYQRSYWQNLLQLIEKIKTMNKNREIEKLFFKIEELEKPNNTK
jgi:hypothetical protein